MNYRKAGFISCQGNPITYCWKIFTTFCSKTHITGYLGFKFTFYRLNNIPFLMFCKNSAYLKAIEVIVSSEFLKYLIISKVF